MADAVRLVRNKADFDAQLKDAGNRLVIVDFFANWCGPCKHIGPEVEKLAKVMTDVVFLKVDVDEAEDLATEYKINCMPTFVAILNGERVGDMSGASLDELKKLIAEKGKK